MKTPILLLLLSLLPLISAQGQMQEPSIIVLSYNFTDNNTPTSITDPTITSTSTTIRSTTTLKQPPIQTQKTTITIKPTSSTYKSSSRVSPLPPKNTSWNIPELPKIELPDLKTAIPIIGIIILIISYLWHLGGKDENSND